MSALNWHKPLFTHSALHHQVPVGEKLLWTLCGEGKGVFQGRIPMAIELLITDRSDWHLQKSCLEASEGFFFWTRYQYRSPQFNCFRGSRGLPAFVPLVPSNESISSPGTTSWSSFISFGSFSPSFLPAAFSHQYRSAQAATELNCSPWLPPLNACMLKLQKAGLWYREQSADLTASP